MSGDGLGLFYIEEVARLRRENSELRAMMTRWANAPLVVGEAEIFNRLMAVAHNYKEGATIRAFLRQEMNPEKSS